MANTDATITTNITSGGTITTNIANGSAVSSNIVTGGQGPAGAPGNTGYGVAPGGTTNQILKKNSASNYDTSWETLDTSTVPENTNLYFTNARAAAAAPVQSVAGKTGAVTLVEADIANLVADLAAKANTASLGTLATLNSVDLTANVGSTILPVANGGTGSSTKNFVDLTTMQTIGGAKTLTAELDIIYDYAAFRVKNSNTSQYAGASFYLLNTASTMASQAGASFYMGINNTGATQGFLAIDKTDTTGAGTGHLALFDFNANKTTLYQNVEIDQNGSGGNAFTYKRTDNNTTPFYIDGFGAIHFGGTGTLNAQYIFDKDPINTNLAHLENVNGPASILIMDADTQNSGGPNAEGTFTGRIKNAGGASTGTEFIDWFHNHYTTNGDAEYGIMMQYTGSSTQYRPFYVGYFDHADTDSSNIIKDREAFMNWLPDVATGSYAGQTLAGTASTTANSTAVVGVGTSFTSLPVNSYISIAGTSRQIASITDNTHLTTVAAWPSTLSGQTITFYNRFRGRLGLRVHDVSAFLDIAGGVGGSTVGSASLKIRTATALLTTPENGAIENDGTHLYVTLGGTRYQLDRQGGGVTSVFGRTGAITAQTGDYTAAEVGALPSTDDLSAIATANATSADVSMNSHKLTSLADPTSAQDAVTKNYADTTGYIETRSMSSCGSAVASPQQLNGNAFMAGKNFKISTLACYVIVVNASNPTIELGIYDSGYNLLGSATVVPTAEGIWKVTLSSPVSLTKGNMYYLALLNRASGDSTTTFLEGSDFATDTKLSWILSGQTTMPSLASGSSVTGRVYWLMGY